MSPAEPLVTVAVSTYAAADLLAPCLEMLLAQSIGDRLEVIVVDSGSPENEGEVVRPFLGSGRVQYVRTERETLYAAWNRALAMARGRYFANVNTDDWIAPHSLALLASALEANPDCALAYADWAWTEEPASEPTPSDLLCTHAPWAPTHHLFYCYSGCVQFWRRSSLEEIGGFDASLRYCGDLLALRRLADAGMRPVYVPETLWGFHRNPDGLSLSTNGSIEEQRAIHRAAKDETPIERFYAVDPSDPRSVADAWTTLGVLAMRVRVPWIDDAYADTEFALECFERALSFDPNHLDALHDRYAVLYQLGRTRDAEASLDGLPLAFAVTARGYDLELRHATVEPARGGALFLPSDPVDRPRDSDPRRPVEEDPTTPVLRSDPEWAKVGSNHRPSDYESPALTTELLARDAREEPSRGRRRASNSGRRGRWLRGWGSNPRPSD